MIQPREVLTRRKLVVCVGSGGVGKTTTAATMGLWAARQGRKVLVMTIDPARRLANSLGLKEFGNTETQIVVPDLPPGGQLWAMMLDTQTTFDELIQRMAPDKRTADRILTNRIYRTMSDTFAGSQEYMAAEKLYDVMTSGRYDLVVLDTPPVKNALDFFEAPGRLSRFFDRRVIKWFLQPYEEKRTFNPLAAGTSAVVFKLLSFIFGKEFLGDISEFLVLFKDMYDGFRERHEEVLRIFRSPDTSFVTIAAPTEPSMEVAGFFAEELRRRGYPRAGMIVNQVHLCAEEPLEPEILLGQAARTTGADLHERTAASLVARLGAAHGRLRQLAHSERVLIQALHKINPAGAFFVELPWLEQQVYDLGALRVVADSLFADV